MSRLCLLVLLACVNSYVAGQNVSSEAYFENELIPDVLTVLPEGYLTVLYPSGAEVQEGNELTPTQVKDIPTVIWDASPDEFYTLAMIDLDEPSYELPTSREVLHWLVGNVLGTDIEAGDTVAEYIGSGPSENTGLHRYVFLVYRQPEELEFDEPRISNRSTENRLLFSIGNFAKKYDLGAPIAANFYWAEYDDYVPILHAQLGF